MESLIRKFEAAVAPGPERVTPGVVVASGTVKGALHIPFRLECPLPDIVHEQAD